MFALYLSKCRSDSLNVAREQSEILPFWHACKLKQTDGPWAAAGEAKISVASSLREERENRFVVIAIANRRTCLGYICFGETSLWILSQKYY